MVFLTMIGKPYVHQFKKFTVEVIYIWGFPKMVVPPNHPFNRVFHYKPSILGYPYFWKHPYMCIYVYIYIYMLCSSTLPWYGASVHGQQSLYHA